MSRLNPLLLALQFLTRLPVRQTLDYRPEQWGRAVLAFPLAGLAIGLLLTLTSILLTNTATSLLQAGILLTLWVLLTGALHLDGLADTLDAWVGGMGDKDNTLRIMKDPASGPIGVTAILLVLLLKLISLDSLLHNGHWLALLLIPVLARTNLILLLLTLPYAKTSGMGHAMQHHLPTAPAWGIIWLTALLTALISPMLLLIWLLSLLTYAAYRRALQQRLGGTTGDTAGAWVELSETLMLLTASLLLAP